MINSNNGKTKRLCEKLNGKHSKNWEYGNGER